MSNDVRCRDCGQVIGAVPGHACPGFDHEAMAARIAALEAAPRLALRYVARAVLWAHGDSHNKPVTLGAFESEEDALASIAATAETPPNGWSGIHGASVERELVVIAGDVVQCVALGEVIKGGGK